MHVVPFTLIPTVAELQAKVYSIFTTDWIGAQAWRTNHGGSDRFAQPTLCWGYRERVPNAHFRDRFLEQILYANTKESRSVSMGHGIRHFGNEELDDMTSGRTPNERSHAELFPDRGEANASVELTDHKWSFVRLRTDSACQLTSLGGVTIRLSSRADFKPEFLFDEYEFGFGWLPPICMRRSRVQIRVFTYTIRPASPARHDYEYSGTRSLLYMGGRFILFE
jgi:hypothetical protein